MYKKISSILDAIADSLEEKGFIKEAHEVDKIADMIDAAMPYGMETPLTEELKKAISDFRKLGPRPTLEQIRTRATAAFDAAVGKGLDKDRRDRYVDYISTHPQFQNPVRLMEFITNVALKPGFGKQFESQQFGRPE
jgi:hypothetical protein